MGAIMGPETTSGTVIQHLANICVRLVEDSLPVTPPLRRGGSGRNTSAAIPPKKHGVTKVPKQRSIRKKAEPKSDESSNEQSDWKDGESDIDFGRPRVKRDRAMGLRRRHYHGGKGPRSIGRNGLTSTW